jgi:hypothetical protein
MAGSKKPAEAAAAGKKTDDTTEQVEGSHGGSSSRSPSRTPRTRSRGRSLARRGGNDIVVHERVIREAPGGSGAQIVYPKLTTTNYIEWALVMKINLRAQGLWEAVCGEGEPSEREDMAALAALIRAVPAEMVPVLLNKDSLNEAWEAIKLMRMGVSRVHEATAQRLRKEFEAIAFKEGEMLDGFGMRITTLANNLRSLGDTVEEVKIVLKFLREVPPQYA